MGRTVCFIDKEGMTGVCTVEGMEQYDTIDCRRCSFYKQFKGKEKDEFSYCDWLGLEENDLQELSRKRNLKVEGNQNETVKRHRRN